MKTAEAFRTISEVAGELDVPKHVLRFWEGRFPQIKPMKRGGGRRYYRPEDLQLLRGICHLLHAEGYTIKGVQKILREQGIEQVKRVGSEARVPSAVTAATAKLARGGKAMSDLPTHKARSPLSPPRSLPTAPPDLMAQVKAAIAELEICRSLLLGKAIESTARRRAVKMRRAARP
ncbi:MAG TPA: MerR family transcriptional regulator [Hyphomicrobium sp.]|jgi:DNA-binding transcriptional MerR regulator